MKIIIVVDLNKNTGEIVNTIQDAATISGVSTRTISRYISENKLYNKKNIIIFKGSATKNENRVKQGRKFGKNNLKKNNFTES